MTPSEREISGGRKTRIGSGSFQVPILVDRLRVSSHRLKLSDSIDFRYDIRLLNPQIIRDLYEKEGLSSRQTAERLGSSKTSVLKILLKQGLDLKVKMQGRSAEN